MNVADIIIRVRRTFGDEAAVQIQDADVIRWINDGQVEVVKHNEGALQKTGFIDLVLDQQAYTMPADLFILRSLRFKSASTDLSYSNLKYKNMTQFDETADGWDGLLFGDGTPQYYTIYEGKALLFPVPNTSLVSGIKVLYNRKPTDVVLTTDVPDLPLIYHNTLVKYCMFQASLLDEDYDPANFYKTDFVADAALLETREEQEATATYPTITTLEFDQ